METRDWSVQTPSASKQPPFEGPRERSSLREWLECGYTRKYWDISVSETSRAFLPLALGFWPLRFLFFPFALTWTNSSAVAAHEALIS